MRGRGPRCLDRTIAGHDLPHMDVRDGDAALSGAENGLEGLRKVLGFFFFRAGSKIELKNIRIGKKKNVLGSWTTA